MTLRINTVRKMIVSVLVLVLVACSFSAIPAYADEQEIQSGHYVYTVSGEGSDQVATIVKYVGQEPDIVIPETIDGIPVQSIDTGAFEENNTMVTLEIPKHIYYVGFHAFARIPTLKSVKWNASYDYVSNDMFSGCSNLEYAEFSDNIAMLQYNVFKNCSSLETVKFGTSESGLVKINSGSFNGCTSLKTIIYAGKESWWNDINKTSLNDALSQADIQYMENFPTLAAPKNVKVSYDTTNYGVFGIKVTWDPVENAQWYYVEITNPDGTKQTWDAYDYEKDKCWTGYTNYRGLSKIRVRARGYHSNDGIYSSFTKYFKVYTPTLSVKWRKPARSGRTITLKWKKNSYAKGYVLRYFFHKSKLSSTTYKKIVSIKKTSYKIKIPKKYTAVDVNMVPYVKQGKKKIYETSTALIWYRATYKGKWSKVSKY